MSYNNSQTKSEDMLEKLQAKLDKQLETVGIYSAII